MLYLRTGLHLKSTASQAMKALAVLLRTTTPSTWSSVLSLVMGRCAVINTDATRAPVLAGLSVALRTSNDTTPAYTVEPEERDNALGAQSMDVSRLPRCPRLLVIKRANFARFTGSH